MASIGSFGVVRTHVVPAFNAALSELCEIISSISGGTFRPYTAPSYRELAREVQLGEVMLAWMPPVVALQLADQSIADPVALPVRSGMTSYQTAFIVRDRVPKRLQDLRGARVAWVDRESSSGYIVPRIHLASLGCDPREFFSQESFHHSHIAVVDAVATGRVDVGATFQSLDAKGRIVSAGWTSADGTIVRSVKIAATAGPIPNDLIVASKRLPITARASLQRWLLQPDRRSRELFGDIIHSTEFRLPSPEHFQPLRSMMTAARVHHALES